MPHIDKMQDAAGAATSVGTGSPDIYTRTHALGAQMRLLQAAAPQSTQAKEVCQRLTTDLAELLVHGPGERAFWPARAGVVLMTVVSNLCKLPQATPEVVAGCKDFFQRLNIADQRIADSLLAKGLPYGLPQTGHLLQDMALSSPQSELRKRAAAMVQVGTDHLQAAAHSLPSDQAESTAVATASAATQRPPATQAALVTPPRQRARPASTQAASISSPKRPGAAKRKAAEPAEAGPEKAARPAAHRGPRRHRAASARAAEASPAARPALRYAGPAQAFRVEKNRLDIPLFDAQGALTALGEDLDNYPLHHSISYARQAKFHVSELKSEAGMRILVSSRAAQGCYGKCRWAIDMQGRHLAVKEARHVPARRVRPDQTQISDWEGVSKEFQIMRAVHGDRMALSLCHNDKSSYIVMQEMQTDTASIVDTLAMTAARPNPALRLALVAQQLLELSTQLVYAHAHCHVAVLDIKPDNILVDREHTFLLADFGLSSEVDARTQHIVSGPGGSPGYCAPETLLTNVAVTPKADVWSLAISVLLSLRGSDTPDNPLWDCLGDDGQLLHSIPYAAAGYALRNYRDWRQNRAAESSTAGFFDLTTLQPGRSRFDDFFLFVQEVSPELCQMVLDRGLVLDAEKRASSAEILAWAQNFYRQHGTPVAVHQFLDGLDRRDKERASIFAQLDLYRQEVIEPRPPADS